MGNVILADSGLEAKLFMPKSLRKGIVLAHSFRDSMDEPSMADAVEAFSDYAVLAINFVGHGKSPGALRDVSYRAIAQNLSDSIETLKELGVERVGVYARSLGTIATVLSSKRPDVQVFLSPTPLYNPKELLNRYAKYINEEQLKERGYALVTSGSGRGSFEMGREWIEEMQNENEKTFKIHRTKVVPTLIIQGTHDQLLPDINVARKFVERSGDEYIEIQGADHGFSDKEHRTAAIKHALNWFAGKL